MRLRDLQPRGWFVTCTNCGEPVFDPNLTKLALTLIDTQSFEGRNMKEITQPHVGFPYGECVRASYASLFGVPIEYIPRFDPGAGFDKALGMNQREYERSWLNFIGFDCIEIVAEGGDKAQLPSDLLDASPRGYHLISGKSERAFHIGA